MNEQDIRKLTKKEMIRMLGLQEERIRLLEEKKQALKKRSHVETLAKLPRGSFSEATRELVEVLRVTELLTFSGEERTE